MTKNNIQIKKLLIEIDFLIPQNPDYFMLPLKRFIHRINLKKNEFNLLMGIYLVQIGTKYFCEKTTTNANTIICLFSV